MRVFGRRVIAVGLISGVVTIANGQDSPPIARFVPSAPDVGHVFVLDSAHLLSPEVVRMLQDSSRALQAETAADVAWVTLPTLGGRSIEEAALYIGRTWRIGSPGHPGDPLRNRGLVILFIPDKTKTAGSNFRIEVGNGLEGTITDSRSRTISATMREGLRAKHYDDAYVAGWRQAASLVREDFASHGDAGRIAARAAQVAQAARAQVRRPVAPVAQSSASMVVPFLFLAVIVVIFVALIRTRRRGLGMGPTILPVIMPNTDDDERRRAAPWFSANGGGFGSSSGDFGGSSSSDGGSFGDGGGFSGGGSSDTI